MTDHERDRDKWYMMDAEEDGDHDDVDEDGGCGGGGLVGVGGGFVLYKLKQILKSLSTVSKLKRIMISN